MGGSVLIIIKMKSLSAPNWRRVEGGYVGRVNHALILWPSGGPFLLQANVNKNEEQSEWRLDALAAKMVQYCYLLEGLAGEVGHCRIYEAALSVSTKSQRFH